MYGRRLACISRCAYDPDINADVCYDTFACNIIMSYRDGEIPGSPYDDASEMPFTCRAALKSNI